METLALLRARLGRVIRGRRERTGLSQERFGSSVKVHRTYMGHLERGTANATVKVLFQVARGLDLSVAELFALARGDEGDLTLPTKGARRRLQQHRESGTRGNTRKPRRKMK